MPAFDPTRQIHGGTRKLPAPFQRPSIDLDRPTRRWRHVYAYQVTEGDIVRGFGIVSSTLLQSVSGVPIQVWLSNDVAGTLLTAGDMDVLYAFTNDHPDSYPTEDEIKSDISNA